MADRYWVGGSGTWNTSSTTNWSTSSGGASGASAPTASDNVFFDSNSNVGTGAFTVTVSAAVCNDFNAPGASTALDGAMTLAMGSSTLTVSGSWTNQATNFAVTNTAGTLTFNATTTGKTITTNGVTIGVATTLNGVGGAWTLGSAFSCASFNLTLTNGTFDTSSSGNYSVTADAFVSSNSNTRTINLNNSTISVNTNWFMPTSTNATLNAGTSTINLSSTGGSFEGGGLTYYDVSFTAAGTTLNLKGIAGVNIFRNLTFATISGASINNIIFSANQTINGTLTINGANGNQRQFVRSNTLGTSRTLTCAAIAAMTDVDFRDITIAGAAGTLSGTRLGDCGGNSNITFVAGTNKYWNLVAGGSWTATAWATSSGGAVAATNFPLAQDTVIIGNTGLNTSATITINANWNIGTLDSSTRTNAMTLASSTNTPTFYGNFTYGSGVTPTGTGAYTFSNRSTKTLNSGGKTFTQPITINAPSGGIQLVTNNLTLGSTLATTLTQGTLDLNNLTLTTGLFSSSNSNTRTIAFGTGNISCSGTGTVWNMGTVTNLTTTGTQVVNVTSAGSTAITVSSGALSETNSISFNFTGGTYALTFLSAVNYAARNVNFTGYAGTWQATAGVTVYGNLTLSTGMSLTASGSSMLFGATSGTKTITSNGKTIDFPINFNAPSATYVLQDALTLGSTRNTAFTAGTVNLAGFTLTTGTASSQGASTRNITFNGGTLLISGSGTTAWNVTGAGGFSTTAGTGTGTMSMTAATAKTFVGGGSTYNCTLNQGGAGALTITGSNTFTNITNTVQPASVLFTAGTTSTFSNFSLSGTSGNLITIGSVTAASHTLAKASGTVSVSFCSISRSNGVGGATWEALTTNGNVDGGNNTGWFFGSTVYAAVIAETATATDSVLSRAAFSSALAETATATDSGVGFILFPALVVETTTATDSGVGFILFPALVVETTTATDSVLSRAAFSSALAETATATDSVISFADFYAALAETATTTDSILSFADFYAALTETATATDSPLVAPSTFNAPVAETATATDAVSPPGSIYNAPVSETVTISDLVLGAYLWNLIDDSQSVTWQNVNSSPGTVWSPIDTDPDTGWSVIPTVN